MADIILNLDDSYEKHKLLMLHNNNKKKFLNAYIDNLKYIKQIGQFKIKHSK